MISAITIPTQPVRDTAQSTACNHDARDCLDQFIEFFNHQLRIKHHLEHDRSNRPLISRRFSAHILGGFSGLTCA